MIPEKLKGWFGLIPAVIFIFGLIFTAGNLVQRVQASENEINDLRAYSIRIESKVDRILILLSERNP